MSIKRGNVQCRLLKQEQEERNVVRDPIHIPARLRNVLALWQQRVSRLSAACQPVVSSMSAVCQQYVSSNVRWKVW